LKWRFGLRNKEYINISTLGLKAINLSRNNLGDKFIEVLCDALNTDTYIKSIAIAHNCIGGGGFKKLSKIAL